MQKIIKKGFEYLAQKHSPMDCESGVIDFIINLARGDARYALNIPAITGPAFGRLAVIGKGHIGHQFESGGGRYCKAICTRSGW